MQRTCYSALVLRLLISGVTFLFGIVVLIAPESGAPDTVAPRRVGPGSVRPKLTMATRVPGHRSEISTNWSGYSVPNVTDVVSVKGSWIVPAVSPSVSLGTSSTTWIGIDGHGSDTVEQIGTEQGWSERGGARYAAWYELYPFPSYYIDAPVVPGDRISAEVAYLGGGRFGLMMTNETQNWMFQRAGRLPWARRVSAEWVAEAPYEAVSLLLMPLANFGMVSFTNCQATIGGRTDFLGNWPSRVAVTLVGREGVQASPDGVAPGDGSFNVTWFGSQ